MTQASTRGSRLNTSALFLTAVLLTIVFVSLPTQPAQAAMIFEDQFDQKELAPVWAWENPAGRSGISLAESLVISFGHGSDQWVGVDLAPRILKAEPAGTYSLETLVSWSILGSPTFSGLTVFKDANNWLLAGILGNGTLELSGIIQGHPTGVIGSSATGYQWLRLRKAMGNPSSAHYSYYFDASSDGLNWTNINVFHDRTYGLSGPSARVGFLAKSWDASGSTYRTAFDYYREYNADMMPSSLVDYPLSPATTRLGQVTGPQSPQNGDTALTADVCGTDLGIPFTWDDRTYFIFGDTHGCGFGGELRSNALALSYDFNPADGLTLHDWVRDANHASKELIEARWGKTAIPTGAVGTKDNAYVFFMEVERWGSPGFWSCNFASVASAGRSDPGRWTNHFPGLAWGGDFNQLAVLRDPKTFPATLYIFGTPCGRGGSIKLMKVPEDSVLNQGAYSYLAGFNGHDGPVWGSHPGSAITVAGGPAGEISVSYNYWLDAYVMTYLDPQKQGIVIREAPRPWGPWSAPIVIARGSDHRGLYGAFMHDGFRENNGETIFYTMSEWDQYNVAWMRTTLIRRTAP